MPFISTAPPIDTDDFTVDVEGWDHGPTPVRQPFLTVRVALPTEANIVCSGWEYDLSSARNVI